MRTLQSVRFVTGTSRVEHIGFAAMKPLIPPSALNDPHLSHFEADPLVPDDDHCAAHLLY
jgi:hypothetical protein